MNSCKKERYGRYSMKPGFSLVEVIIAVVLLALLAVPILAYFTNAAVSSSSGKNTQKANLAAQTVLEDLDACDTFEQIEEKITDPDPSGAASPWQIKTPYDDTAKAMELERDIEVDDYTYHAVIKLDYNEYTGLTDRFNNYDEPQLKEVYAKTNIVFAEGDQEEEALSEFLYSNPTKSKADIKSAMKREIHFSLKKESSGTANVYQAAGFYRYTYGSESYDAYLDNTKIQSDQLENVYFFYNVMDGHENSDEEIRVNYDMNVDFGDAGKLNVYYICQKTTTLGLNYKLHFNGSGNYTQSKYFTNGITTNLASYKDDFVEPKFDSGKIKRIAKVTVDVYDKSSSSKSVVHLETSKGA